MQEARDDMMSNGMMQVHCSAGLLDGPWTSVPEWPGNKRPVRKIIARTR